MDCLADEMKFEWTLGALQTLYKAEVVVGAVGVVDIVSYLDPSIISLLYFTQIRTIQLVHI